MASGRLDEPGDNPPRDAATVVVIRCRERRLELFCVERHPRSGFMGGALVFPGGKVDAADGDPSWEHLATPLTHRARDFAKDEATARVFAIAALREALEEAAILPVVGDGLDAAQALALRAELGQSADQSLLRALRGRNLVLDTGRLEAVARWITPTAEPKRFDTRFYLLTLPSGQTGAHDEHETTRSFWATPEEILERWERREVHLAPPTSFTIALFCGVPDVEGAIAIARRQSLAPVLPCFVQDGGQMILTLPGDPLHPDPPGSLAGATGPTRFTLEDGRFVPQKA